MTSREFGRHSSPNNVRMKKREAENLVEMVFICQSSIISQILDSMYRLNSYEFLLRDSEKLEHFLAHSFILPVAKSLDLLKSNCKA